MTRFRTPILLAVLVFLAFGNCLSHQFTGDAKVIFEHNNFYKEARYFPRLFSRDFVMGRTIHLFTPSDEAVFSGAISYRPVFGLSYFIDYAIWKGNPAGHHLSNILLHLVVVILLFYQARRLTGREAVAFLAAALFAVHPVQTEVVNSVGYRSDILAAIFFIAAFLFYIKYAAAPKARQRRYLIGTTVMFFFALFSKETATVFPVIILAYDRLLGEGRPWPELLKKRRVPYAAIGVVLAFFIFVYLVFAPSYQYSRLLLYGGGWASHLLLTLEILFHYVSALFLPFTVGTAPPLYAPLLSSIRASHIAVSLAFLAALVYLIIRLRHSRPVVSLGLVWFLATYLPASNIIPLPNPFAFRFLYIPCAGLFLSAAVLIEEGIARLRRRIPSSKAGLFIRLAVIGLLVCWTVPINVYYSNNVSLCKSMIREFPDSSRPYWILGLTYSAAGKYRLAEHYFQMYMHKKINNPFIPQPKNNALAHYYLGLVYTHLDTKKALKEFQTAARIHPDYLPASIELARMSLIQKNYPLAVKSALAALRMKPDLVMVYIYAASGYLGQGEKDKALAMIRRAIHYAPGNKNLRTLLTNVEKGK